MNILFISDNFPPERNAGAGRVYEHARLWARWGHQVTVVTGAPNFPEGRVHQGYRNCWHRIERMDGIRVVRVKTFIAPNEGVFLRAIDFISFMFSSIVAAVFEPRPDVVVATSPQFFSAIAGAFIARAKRVPFIFELRDLWPASITAVGAMRSGRALRAIERIELRLYRNAAKVVALTHSFRDDLVARGIDAEKIAVVLNGVEMSRFAPRPRNQELAAELGLTQHFVIGYIGTHGMAHALDRVLEAADLLRANDRLRFLFVGAGASRAHLIAEAQRRKLNNVVFVPAQPKERMPDYWSLCDLALVHLKNIPVFSAVIPSKMFEAMAMKVPIVLAAPEGEASELVRKHRAGKAIAAEDPAALAQAIEDLWRSPETRSQFARNALGAAAQYSREKQAQAMLETLVQVCRSTSSALRRQPETQPATDLQAWDRS